LTLPIPGVRLASASFGEDRGGACVRERPRVLIADQQPTARASLRLLLERDGFAVCAEAADAAQAVEAALREHPDVCVIDVLLPDDGISVIREITERAPGVAVIAFTASREPDHLLAAMRAGAAGYLLKDMSPERLPHAIRGVLRGEAAIPRTLVTWLLDELRSQGRRHAIAGRAGRADLSGREWEVARLLVDGLTTAEIARRLDLARATVRRHISSIVRKLGVSDREEAVAVLGDQGVEPRTSDPPQTMPRRTA
jgi:DNA-binding NarL/FixJ family response regulator